MARISISAESKVLGMSVPVEAVIPDEVYQNHEEDLSTKVVYVLHGTGHNQTSWLRNTSIERYANERNLALIFPFAARSVYADQKYGMPYWTYLSQELPTMCEKLLPISREPSKTYVAGLSMGGYGALKWGLRFPERFAGIIALSAGIDRIGLHTIDGKTISSATEEERHAYERSGKVAFGWKGFYEFEQNFGTVEEFTANGNDLFQIARSLATGVRNVPKIYIAIGTEDPNYSDNQRFCETLDQCQISYTYEEDKGAHEWSFWDKYIQRAFDWIG